MFLRLVLISVLISVVTPVSAQSISLNENEKQWIENNNTIYYGYDPAWQPVEFAEDGEHVGITADICKLLSERTGLELIPHPEVDSWQKSTELFDAGEVSFLSCLAENEERSKIMNFTTTYLAHSFVIVTAKDGKFVGSIDDLMDKTVVAPEGYYITSLLEKERKLKLTYTDGVKESMMKISTGEADATVGNIAVISYYLNYEGFENLKIAAPTDYHDMELKMGVQKEDTILLGILNKGLNSISLKERNEITQNWVSVTYEHGVNMEKVWTIAGISAGVIAIIFAVIFYWNRKLKKEITLRKEAEEQLQESYDEISMQKIVIEEKNREVLDSIKYAKRLQAAIMPSLDDIDKAVPKNFVLYKPKDIVAGDFYWMEKIKENGQEKIYIAAADCTGHGVPGAMVSVVCSNALNRSLLEYGHRDPADILDQATELVVKRFSKSEDNVKDGMDISMCSLKREGEFTQIEYSGAHNNLWIVSDREDIGIASKVMKSDNQDKYLHEITATKRPVGMFHKDIPFESSSIKLIKGERIYLYSDGFADQFGGSKGKKMKNKTFKKMLVDSIKEPLTDQKERLNNAFEEWKADFEQLDDVCVIGIEI